MIKEIIEIKKIEAPNIDYNSYELIQTENFWCKKEYFVRAKNRSGKYTKEKKITLEGWNIIRSEINLLNRFIYGGVKKDEWEYIKSIEFKEKIKTYFGKNIQDSEYICIANPYLQKLIQKYWALELWIWYLEPDRLEGLGQFNPIDMRSSVVFVGGDLIFSKKTNGFWDWPYKYGLIY